MESDSAEHSPSSDDFFFASSFAALFSSFFFSVFIESGTGISPSSTMYLKHCKMQLFSLKISDPKSCVSSEGASGYFKTRSLHLPPPFSASATQVGRSDCAASCTSLPSFQRLPVHTRTQYPRINALHSERFLRQGSWRNRHFGPFRQFPFKYSLHSCTRLPSFYPIHATT